MRLFSPKAVKLVKLLLGVPLAMVGAALVFRGVGHDLIMLTAGTVTVYVAFKLLYGFFE